MLVVGLILLTATSANHFELASSLERRKLSSCLDPNPFVNISHSAVSPLEHHQNITVNINGVFVPSKLDWIAVVTPSNSDISTCLENEALYIETGDLTLLPLLCHYPMKRPAETMVRALRDSMRQLHTCPDEILEMASVYYETLFTSDLLTGDVLDARDDVWSFVRPVVSGDMQTTIMQPFSLQEVTDAVHGLDGASCLGDDGLTLHVIGHSSLIPKGGDASTLRQWRPITLMSLDCSILDNVVTFYEAVEWARQTGQLIAIMLLDFEKAYDRVDWGFLEGILHRMGFPGAWIRGIFALYRSSSVAVTIGGHVGRTFALSRSVRQGCPLAPYLFLFFAETMASIHSVFCCASGSLINRHKSSGFVVGVDDVCTWGEHRGFTWVAPGQTCRYLGFHVGLDVSPRQQFEPVLASIRRKLCHWSSMHLSLAGRALVVNQVLLATAWFTTSCWTLYPQALSCLRRLVRNFLWGGSDGTRDTRTRVSWRTVILPKQEGGLGIIDPEMQSATLLSKLIVRGLYLGEEPWKQFVIHGLCRCVPSSGWFGSLSGEV
ncbi:hypothetical protein L7F22_014539 [Adiantum nelumboides]|nr:hypothetical protein [Adiantum nelumboides]